MAFKLTKAEETRKAELEGDLNEIIGKTEDGKSELEEAITELIEKFNEDYVTPLNAKLAEVRGFVEDIANERQGEWDDKSERWQEGERGEAAQEWVQTWENAVDTFDELSPVEVPQVEFDLPDPESELADLPIEMEA